MEILRVCLVFVVATAAAAQLFVSGSVCIGVEYRSQSGSTSDVFVGGISCDNDIPNYGDLGCVTVSATVGTCNSLSLSAGAGDFSSKLTLNGGTGLIDVYLGLECSGDAITQFDYTADGTNNQTRIQRIKQFDNFQESALY